MSDTQNAVLDTETKPISSSKEEIKVDDKIIEGMFRAGVQFGCSRTTRHPKMKKYLAGAKNNVEIFDLKLTYQELEKAKEFMAKIGAEGRTVLFVGTKVEANDAVQKAAGELNMPYVTERWLGGILTNYKALKGRVDFLISQKQKKAAGEFIKYTKKEQSLIDKEMAKLNRFLAGLEVSKEMPAVLVIVDPKKESIAVKEAKRNKIPVVAIANSDCNPQLVEYAIPANDSSVTSIEYILNELAKAYRRVPAGA